MNYPAGTRVILKDGTEGVIQKCFKDGSARIDYRNGSVLTDQFKVIPGPGVPFQKAAGGMSEDEQALAKTFQSAPPVIRMLISQQAKLGRTVKVADTPIPKRYL